MNQIKLFVRGLILLAISVLICLGFRYYYGKQITKTFELQEKQYKQYKRMEA